MSQPLLIVAFGEVRPIMGSAAFLSGEGTRDDGLRDIEKGLEFEGLYEFRVEYLPFVLHRDRGGVMAERRECRERSRHGFVSPNEAEIEAHHLAEFLPNLPSSDRSILFQQPLDARLLD